MKQTANSLNSSRRCKVIIGAVIMAPLLTQVAFGYLVKKGSEFAISPPLVGDQIHAQVSLSENGGLMVWEDNAIDGEGKGIALGSLDEALHLEGDPILVNQTSEGDQTKPQIATNADGISLVAWEQDGVIHGRLVDAEGSFLGDVFSVSSPEFDCQNVRIEVIDDNKFAAIWQSDGQDGHRSGIFGQIFDDQGRPTGSGFGVNENVFQNQRDADLVALPRGDGFMAAWISETPLGTEGDYAVNVWGRTFDSNGMALGAETQLSDSDIIAASPQLAAAHDGTVALAYSGMLHPALSDVVVSEEWGLHGAKVNAGDLSISSEVEFSSGLDGQHYDPQLVGLNQGVAVVWTQGASKMSDSDVRGLIWNGRDETGSLESTLLSSNHKNAQLMPTFSAKGDQEIVAFWSSFEGGVESFEIKGQEFDLSSSGVVLPEPADPFFYSTGFNKLTASWPVVEGVNVDHYRVYLNGSATPMMTEENFIEIDSLADGSEHRVQWSYVSSNGVESPLSGLTVGRAWSQDSNSDGLPDQFQATYWGGNKKHWEDFYADSDGDGLNNLEELLAGTNPLNPRSVLNIGLVKTDGVPRLTWEMQPGGIYQIESSGDLAHWTHTGAPFLATEYEASMPVNTDQAKRLYRVVRLK